MVFATQTWAVTAIVVIAVLKVIVRLWSKRSTVNTATVPKPVGKVIVELFGQVCTPSVKTNLTTRISQAVIVVTDCGVFFRDSSPTENNRDERPYFTIAKSDILACQQLLAQGENHVSLFAFIPENVGKAVPTVVTSKRVLVVARFVLETDRDAQTLETAITTHLTPTTKRRIAVVLNPISGKRKGTKLFSGRVNAIFSLVPSLSFDIKTTQYSGHAREIGKTLDCDMYQGIVCVGGDGTVHEVVNGILQRQDGRVPALGVIPTGSGNGLATILSDNDIDTSAFVIAKGETATIDIARVTFDPPAERVTLKRSATTGTGEGGAKAPARGKGKGAMSLSRISSIYSFLHVSFGVVADCDFESEAIWWLGVSRFDVWAVWRILRMRTYDALLECATSVASKAKTAAAPLAPLSEVGRRFFWVGVCNVPYMASNALICPDSRHDDGMLTLTTMGVSGRWASLMVLLGLETGSHVSSSAWNSVTTTHARLTLGRENERGVIGCGELGGLIDVDGEPLRCRSKTAIDVTTVPSALTVMTCKPTPMTS